MLQQFVKVPVSGSKCSAQVEENRPFDLLLLLLLVVVVVVIVIVVVYTIQYK